eukprot:TRINITY_DN4644_c0_g1_i2.p1 TRINITY_DN4644_c0_g1~~TRINITY_DN4644_c0_g1_i2.p1  ORF type:complete len:188 (+),score=58.61 TRINITY_DN4644_c0_g1_i2:52-615(+)
MNTQSTSHVPAATSTGIRTWGNKGKGGLWHPYVNQPSKTQRIMEILSFLIILASVPAFLGGVYGIFVVGYGTALGLLGLFAWPRRHSVIYLISCLLFGLWLIAVLILTAKTDQCLPFYDPTYVDGVAFERGQYCGSDTFSYIDTGILLVLTILAFFFALKVATEKRPEPGTLVHQSTTTTTSAPLRM